jgi:putative transposase
MTRFIDDHRERFGVTTICDVLGWNVSTYYAHRRRPPSDRALRDELLAEEVRRVWAANYRVYGYRKIHAQLKREGFAVAECTVRRLMRQEGIAGVVRGHKKPKTTIRDDHAVRPPDLLDRDFTAPAPNLRWSPTSPTSGWSRAGSCTSRSSWTCSPG